MMGLNLADHASMIAVVMSTHCSRLYLIRSTRKIAVLTTSQINEINHIANAILYGLPVIRRPILTHKNAVMIEYSKIAGRLNEL